MRRGHRRLSVRTAVPSAAFLAALTAMAAAQAAAAGKPQPHHPSPPPFQNRVDPPPTPAKVTFGSSLLGAPEAREGNFEADTEFWQAVFAAAGGISGVQRTTTVPVGGWLTGVAIHGHAVSGDMPGPGGSQPFRIGVEEALPGGTLKVLETSTPPFTLPGAEGTYYYWFGPPYTSYAMRLKPGEVVSFDTRGGTWAIFSHQPGSIVSHTTGSGQEQNAGVQWTGIPHEEDELQMQVVEQPTVPTAPLDSAAQSTEKAITAEQAAIGKTRGKALVLLRTALHELREVDESVEDAEESSAGAIGHTTAVSLRHFLSAAESADRAAESRRLTISGRGEHIKTALAAKRQLLSDIRQARSLARKVP